MTPFELQLRHELDGAFVRMANGWFSKWHNINIERMVVDVEDFYGGRFHTGGVKFQGQIQELYWRSVGKYLVDKVHETFRQCDEATKGYPREQRRSALEATGTALWGFVAQIIEHGVETDRALRGRGDPRSVSAYNASGYHTAANVEIERLKKAYLALLPAAPVPVSTLETAPDWKTSRISILRKAEDFFANWRGWLTMIGIIVAIIGIMLRVFGIV